MASNDQAARLLRTLREQRGESLREAADGLGVAASHLSRVERGEKASSSELTNQMAKYYNTNSDLLILDQGRIPDDVIAILQEHPELLDQIRSYKRAMEA